MSWSRWGAAILCAALLELPFPLAGPLPPWRAVFAWFGLVPLMWAVLSLPGGKRAPRQAFFIAYLCGILWYAGNCYWIYDTMHIYGALPPVTSALLLAGFSLVLGLYFGLFGWGIAFARQKTGSMRMALALAPFLWTALDLAAARITSVPWDQLGYSQVDNGLINRLAPWTGVYGITFLIVAVNALIAGNCLFGPDSKAALFRSHRYAWASFLGILVAFLGSGVYIAPQNPAPSAEAVLLQPNLNVGGDNYWNGPVWDRNLAQIAQLARDTATKDRTYIAGIPQTGAPLGEIVPPPYATHPDLVVWPEAPAFSFEEADPRFQQAMTSMARWEQAPLIVGGYGMEFSASEHIWDEYNSAMVFAADGQRLGRYDKIHLVPYGEYIPYRDLFFFAHKLTGKISDFSRGTDRTVFRIANAQGQTHRYGIFICYESVFADEVRQFARNGAEVLVNISDDGWYGDTSAPWQHLNMARMRAIENRRWLLRDTNNGVTAAIDPNGRVRQSIPRHQVDALPAQFGFRSDETFYTAHGDVFAWICAILSISGLGWSIGTGKQ